MNPAESYILKTPEPFREILLHLKTLIEYSVPEAQLLYKWHLPFYYLNSSMFCFLNYRKTFVELSIPKGIELPDRDKLIAGEGRKSLRSLRFLSSEDIDEQLVLSVLSQLKDFKVYREQNS